MNLSTEIFIDQVDFRVKDQEKQMLEIHLCLVATLKYLQCFFISVRSTIIDLSN